MAIPARFSERACSSERGIGCSQQQLFHANRVISVSLGTLLWVKRLNDSTDVEAHFAIHLSTVNGLKAEIKKMIVINLQFFPPAWRGLNLLLIRTKGLRLWLWNGGFLPKVSWIFVFYRSTENSLQPLIPLKIHRLHPLAQDRGVQRSIKNDRTAYWRHPNVDQDPVWETMSTSSWPSAIF